MKAYLVRSYDPTPYSDIPDYNVCVFMNEGSAKRYVEEANDLAYLEMDESMSVPYELYDYVEIGVF